MPQVWCWDMVLRTHLFAASRLFGPSVTVVVFDAVLRCNRFAVWFPLTISLTSYWQNERAAWIYLSLADVDVRLRAVQHLLQVGCVRDDCPRRVARAALPELARWSRKTHQAHARQWRLIKSITLIYADLCSRNAFRVLNRLNSTPNS